MRLLLCGFGSIGRRHLANARTLVAPASRWTIVEPARAAWQPAADVDFVEALDAVEGDFDVALVCSPTHLHAEQLTRLAGRAGAFFIEKPLAHDRAGLEAIRQAFATHAVPVMVGCNYRFEAGLARLKALLDEGTIGRPLSLRAEFGQYLPGWRPHQDYRQGYAARRATGGGIILDRIHELDYACWLLGPVAEVHAVAGKLSDLEIETEDTAELALRFASGALGSVHVDYLQREYTCTCKVVGERGTLTWRYRPTLVRHLDETGAWREVFEEAAPDVNAMYIAELRHFFAAIGSGRRPSNGLDEAGRTLELALAAHAGVRP